MTHVTEEQLVSYALADAEPGTEGAIAAHLESCDECRHALEELRRVLDATAIDVPERGADYGARVWARLEPRLPAATRARRMSVPRWFVAAAAVLLAVSAFLVGRWSGNPPASEHAVSSRPASAPDSRSIRERVVLAALSDHFDRTERTLVELANTDASGLVDISAEQAWARDLLEANRLYRQSARGAASPPLMELLGEIEPILLEIVNSPSRLTADDVHALQSRIEDRSLVFKLRVTGAQVRARQRTLTQPGEPRS